VTIQLVTNPTTITAITSTVCGTSPNARSATATNAAATLMPSARRTAVAQVLLVGAMRIVLRARAGCSQPLVDTVRRSVAIRHGSAVSVMLPTCRPMP
jgi:hypothetical protein